MADTQLLYPRGQIALGSGDLIDVTNVKIDQVNNAKQVHTIRQKGAGFSLGVEETTVSFDAVVSDQGEERDWLDLLKKGRIKQIRIKTPGRTMTVNGVVSSISTELPLDDAIKMSLTFIGHTDD
jgi:hypothetical protein